LFGSRVVIPENSERATLFIRALNKKITTDNRVNHVLLSVGDGMTLVRRAA
jgi:hypothetical protein